MSIPKIIHRVWVGGPMPAELEELGETWKATHPGWEHRLWTDSDLDWLANRDIYDAARSIVAGHHLGQFRANLARYEVVAKHGGVYVDCDLEALKPLDPLTAGGAWAAWEHETGRWGPLIGNTILASEPGHPFWRRTIDQARRDVVTYRGQPSWKMTGPAMLTRLQAEQPQLSILPQRWFYPYPTHKPDRAVGNYGDAYTVHHWAHYRGRGGHDIPPPRRTWPPRLSVAIMAHPSRARQVDKIVAALDGDAEVIWDRKGEVWDTSRRAWLSYTQDATHHLVLQDDVVPCRDLIAGLTRAVAQVPTSPISAYTMAYRLNDRQKSEYDRAVDLGAPWWRDTGSLSGQAILLPVADIEEMVATCDRMQRPEDDLKIRDFYRRRQVEVWQTVPSLVEHLDLRDGNRSLIPGNDSRVVRRTSMQFIGTDRSALDVDWSTAPEVITQ